MLQKPLKAPISKQSPKAQRTDRAEHKTTFNATPEFRVALPIFLSTCSTCRAWGEANPSTVLSPRAPSCHSIPIPRKDSSHFPRFKFWSNYPHTGSCAFFRHLPAKLQVSFQHCPCPDTHRCFKAQNTRVKIRWKGAFPSGGPPILSPTDSIQNTALTYSIQGARTICCTHTLGEMLRTKVKSLDQLHPAAAVCWTGQFYTATPRAAGAVLLPAAIQNKPQGAAGQPELLRWSARNFWAFWPLKWSDSDTAESLHTAGKTKHKVRTLDFCYSPKSG